MPFGDQALDSSFFNVGDIVSVRCLVNSISGGQGAGSRVNLTVETPGNLGDVAGVTLSVSPVQCRRANGSVAQPAPTNS
jgi:hypothetical protein